jgi:uncharacterized OB-fold protein
VNGYPVAQNLFVGREGSTRLLAARSRVDNTYRFPPPVGADAALYDAIELGPSGTLWSFTIQRFRPKPPYNGRGTDDNFVPFAVGYVEFPHQLIIEGRIVVQDFRMLKIGLAMVVTTEAYRDDDQGNPVLTYAFAIDHGKGGLS